MSDVTMSNRPGDETTYDIGDADDERDATWLRGNDERELAEYDVDSVTHHDDDDVQVPSRTMEETLRQVQRELCLIRLCWPEVLPTTETLYARSLPDAYRCVNDKERLLLWYAENFRRQFHARHTDRRPLLLACENECGVQKFVSTSIRRCTPQYPELYTWQGCASFISDYICYEAPYEAFLMVSKRAFLF
ncbi:dynein regulatory complex subunit 7-like [Odontomachus brunneus]|uniref:dynein regulatory complex subunit 7-like n=1 Tax=Odontomachus brunneus TaxID=486640 RepID=UPI0013F22C61|nr:dynein regulatory complex subunit 7-like [Odontomachus brunneus]